jgi:hypothetical protein
MEELKFDTLRSYKNHFLDRLGEGAVGGSASLPV